MTLTRRPAPRRGEIWTANLGGPSPRHWIVVVSLDSRNLSDRVDTILFVPFSSGGVEGPTTLKLEPGETGLPGASYLKGHFIGTLHKSLLIAPEPRILSNRRMREVVALVHRAIDPDAPWDPRAATPKR